MVYMVKCANGADKTEVQVLVPGPTRDDTAAIARAWASLERLGSKIATGAGRAAEVLSATLTPDEASNNEAGGAK